jgi:tetratricopeptide (TPR) repeat protein
VYNYGRWNFWRSALRVFESNPFGVGLGGYKYLWFTTQEPFLHAFRHYSKYPITPHNEYLEVLAGLGFAGFLLFIAVLVLPLWYAWRGRKGVPEERQWIVSAALAGLVLTGTNALFNFNFHEFGLVFTDVLLLGILLGSLPQAALGESLSLRPAFVRTGAVLVGLLGLFSLSLLGGALALGRGEAFVRGNRLDAAEASFRLAGRFDPFRAAIPDALSALNYRRYVAAAWRNDPRADERLLASIRWQARAMELCPLEQGYPFRQANLFIEKYRRSMDPGDLETVLEMTTEILRANPYLVEGLWIRAHAFLGLGRTEEAIGTLKRAVSIEPNFCRGYAKLAEVSGRTDSPEAGIFEAKALECGESAKNRLLEDGERWLVMEPGTFRQGGTARQEGGVPQPPGPFPSL